MSLLHRRHDGIDKLYDGFAVKDLTRREFRRQYLALVNPKTAQRDLARVQNALGVEAIQRRRIDARILPVG